MVNAASDGRRTIMPVVAWKSSSTVDRCEESPLHRERGSTSPITHTSQGRDDQRATMDATLL